MNRIHFEHNRPDDQLDVRMDIYDMNGKLIKSLTKHISSGSYANSDFTWDGRSDQGATLNSGIYICKVFISSFELQTESEISSQMILIK